jgi:hypothetical protein
MDGFSGPHHLSEGVIGRHVSDGLSDLLFRDALLPVPTPPNDAPNSFLNQHNVVRIAGNDVRHLLQDPVQDFLEIQGTVDHCRCLSQSCSEMQFWLCGWVSFRRVLWLHIVTSRQACGCLN